MMSPRSQDVPTTGAPDAELLEQFRSGSREPALGEIVRRHGALVLGVARRVLGEGSDADDVFQDTFLVLIQNSGSIQKGESLGHWLYGVALRTALQAGSTARRRKIRELEGSDIIARRGAKGDSEHEVLPVLDEELAQLPEELRRPLQMCYFEGRTHLEAAKELGRPPGTLSYLMDRGRELLRQRLVLRGVGVTGAVLAALLAGQESHAAVPAGLVAATLSRASATAWPALMTGAGPALPGAPLVGGLVMGTKGLTVAGFASLLALALLFGAGGGVLLGVSRSREGPNSSSVASGQAGSRHGLLTSPESRGSVIGALRAPAGAILAREEFALRLRLFRDLLRKEAQAVNAAAREVQGDDRILPVTDPGVKSQREKRQKREAAEEVLVAAIKTGWQELHASVPAERDTFVELLRDPESNDISPALLVLAETEVPSESMIRLFLAHGDFSMLPQGYTISSRTEVPAALGDLYERLLLAGNSSLTSAILDLQLLPLDALEPHWPKLLSEKDPAALARVIAALRSDQTLVIVNLDTESEEVRAADPTLKRQTELMGEVLKKSQDWSVRMDLLAGLKHLDTPQSREIFWRGLGELIQPGNTPPDETLERLPELFDGGPPKPDEEDRYALLLSRALRFRYDGASDAFETLGQRVFSLPLPKAVRLLEDLEPDVPKSYREGIRQVLGQIALGETRSDALAQFWYESGTTRRR
jgi:RNA polymerase sigma factor (sigma-70 family)